MEKKILLIDDSHDLLMSTEMILRHQGYMVTTATSGLFGLKKAVELEPDLIILDLMMRDMDGWEFMRRKLGEPSISRLPIIIVTGYPDVKEPIAQAKVSVLVKPVSPDTLLETIKAVLDREDSAPPPPAYVPPILPNVPPNKEGHN